ncbi:MAG: RNA-directed DNA polymerase, partial [Proteobacteria bacterium]|nr:RNA-directed DNA polymerase [Pseudomonadota bacterium]
MDNSFRLAIKNVAHFGDTDIFPFPIENRIFEDKPDLIQEQLKAVHEEFDEHLNRYAPVNQSALAPVGYTGFRWATQIDPLWNAYFLSMVIELGPAIEMARLSADRRVVHSYRFAPDTQSGSLFDSSYGWKSFQAQSMEHAKKYPWVLVCDIADFYSRIYHHRLDNALLQLKFGGEIHQRIMTLLQKFSNNASYGLPVGGPASRLLSELVLNRTDRLLVSDGLCFCRFADDYHIFANTEEDAYRALV